MINPENCPYCRAEEQPGPNRPGGAFHDGWRCGTRRFLLENIRTDLCREREEHNKSRAEVERLTGKLKHALYVLKSYNPSYSDVFDKEFK